MSPEFSKLEPEKKLTRQQVEDHMRQLGDEAHREFVALERSKFHPSGWNPGFHAPGDCMLDHEGVHIAVDEKSSEV